MAEISFMTNVISTLDLVVKDTLAYRKRQFAQEDYHLIHA